MIRIINITAVFILLAASILCGQNWQPAASMPLAVSSGQAVVHDDHIYIISGWSDSLAAAAPVIQIYDPRTDTWQVRNENNIARRNFYLLTAIGSVYWGGGMAEMADANQNLLQWDYSSQPVIQANHQVFDRMDAKAWLAQQVCYLFGGYRMDGTPNLPFISGYDLVNKKIVYEETATFPGELPYQQQAAERDGLYYLFGGIYNGVLNRIFRFDPYGPSLERLPVTLMQPRAAGLAVTGFNNNMYLIGGYNEAQAALSSVEIFGFENGAMFAHSGPALKTPRRETMAASFGERLYVFGGKDYRGESLRSVEQLYIGQSTAVDPERVQQPRTTHLGHNYPNPFNLSTCIPVALPHGQSVRIEIIDSNGRLVKVLHSGLLGANEHRFIWNGANEQDQTVAAGIYFCRLLSDECYELEKMLLLP
jgi:hypothetical protein